MENDSPAGQGTQQGAVGRRKPVEGGLEFCRVCDSTSLTSHTLEVLGHPVAETTSSRSTLSTDDLQRLPLLGQGDENDQATCGQSG